MPNDAISKGYKKTSAYNFEQVFYSAINNFEGTEKDFLQAGLAYCYSDNEKCKRFVLTGK